MSQSCRYCVFWQEDGDWRGVGECRRRAPSVPVARKIVGGTSRHERAVFPYTSDMDWCGEFEPGEKER